MVPPAAPAVNTSPAHASGSAPLDGLRAAP